MPVSRKRSCAACRVAKTRCSLTFPTCVRCKSRRLKCDYGDHSPHADSEYPGVWIRDADASSVGNAGSNISRCAQEGPSTIATFTGTGLGTPEQMTVDTIAHLFHEIPNELRWSPDLSSTAQPLEPSPGDKLSTLLDFDITELDQDIGSPWFQNVANNLEPLSFRGTADVGSQRHHSRDQLPRNPNVK